MVIEGDKDEWEVSLLKNHWLLSSLCICCSFVPGTSRAGQGRADMDTGQVWIQGKYGYRTGMDTGQVWIMDQEAGQWHLLGCYGDQVKVRQEKTSRGLVGLYSKSRISGRMQSQESSWSTMYYAMSSYQVPTPWDKSMLFDHIPFMGYIHGLYSAHVCI